MSKNRFTKLLKNLSLPIWLALLLLVSVGAAYAAWGTPVTVDSSGTVGRYTSLAVINGNPAISYRGSGDLMYVRATDARGFTWGAPVSVDASALAQYTSLDVVNGKPAIAYYDENGYDLEYARATDADGSNWGAPVKVDTTSQVGEWASLAVVNGNPAISYYYFGGRDLRYVRATDADGSAWGAPVNVVTTSIVGEYTSLAVVNGFPAISYYSNTSQDLMYVRATDADGSAWGAPVSVDTLGGVGKWTSLAVINGNPAISYLGLGGLKYVRATGADGSAWGAPVSVDASNAGEWTSLAVINGFPAISYYSAAGGGNDRNLMYAQATDANGSTWGAPIAVDATWNVGEYTSLADVDGEPAISYFNAVDGDLKYVRIASAFLAITKTVETARIPIWPGDPITYTIVVANNGDADAPNVSITDTLPTYVTGSNLNTTTNNIAINESVTLTIRATLVVTAPDDEVITNTAYYSHTSGSGQNRAVFTVANFVYLPVILK